MKPKSEQNIFPDKIPLPPEDYKGFQKWAQDISTTLNDTHVQLFNLYNRHLSDALAHPAMWKSNRVFRQSYFNETIGSLVIRFDTSVTKPFYLITGETRQVAIPQGYKLYISSEAVTCNLGRSGPGGLDTGTVAANTVYYLYAVVDLPPNQENVAVIASVRPPSLGPVGYKYGEWMYQGAVATRETQPNLGRFTASCGMYISEAGVEEDIFSGSITAITTFNALPVTARFAYIQAYVTSLAGSVFGINGEALIQTAFSTNDKNWIGPSLMKIRSGGVFNVQLGGGDALIRLRGWLEDTTEWA